MSETGSYVPFKPSVVEVIGAPLCCHGCGIIANNGLKVWRDRGQTALGEVTRGGILTLFYCRICAFTEHEAKVLFERVAKAKLLLRRDFR